MCFVQISKIIFFLKKSDSDNYVRVSFLTSLIGLNPTYTPVDKNSPYSLLLFKYNFYRYYTHLCTFTFTNVHNIHNDTHLNIVHLVIQKMNE